MINPENSSLDYGEISIRFKNEAIHSEGADAAVYVEGKEDTYFWRNVLRYAKPDKQYEFYYNSNLAAVDEEEYRSGSGECVKFYGYTDIQFIVCVDSDYSYLLDKHKFSSTDLVFQTYTYSIENHYCFAENMQAVIGHLTGQSDFDFKVFLTEYSEIIYELFLMSVMSEKKGDGHFFIGKFEDACKISRSADITNNGKNELKKLESNVFDKLTMLKSIYTQQEINTLKNDLQKKGLTPQTTYLFIKGHSLIELYADKAGRPKIINNLNYKIFGQHRIETKSKGVAAKDYLDYLLATITYEGYWQIEKLLTDIKVKL